MAGVDLSYLRAGWRPHNTEGGEGLMKIYTVVAKFALEGFKKSLAIYQDRSDKRKAVPLTDGVPPFRYPLDDFLICRMPRQHTGEDMDMMAPIPQQSALLEQNPLRP